MVDISYSVHGGIRHLLIIHQSRLWNSTGFNIGPSFVQPLHQPFDQAEKILAYADNNYPIGIGTTKDAALEDLQQKVIIAE